jgi:hypothetical protein
MNASRRSPRSGRSFVAHLLKDGYDVRTIQELLGHKDVHTTVYMHVLNRGGRGVHSPLDRLRKAPSTESGGMRVQTVFRLRLPRQRVKRCVSS